MSVVKSQITTNSAAQYAATDMLHRRVLLPYRFELLLGTSTVLIKTDAALMKMALSGYSRSSMLVGEVFAAVWEIAVEVQSNTAAQPHCEAANGFDDYWVGPSRSLRMSSGSWFAYTPPSLDGVGFAMIAGDECSQIAQLAALLDNIKLFLGDSAALNRSKLECEVPA
jgi:hypothetical protein